MSVHPTNRVARLYERTARSYDRSMRLFDKLLFAGGREWVCSRAKGRVLEIAIGTGRNLEHYSKEVDLAGLEVSPAMLGHARRRAVRSGLPVELLLGDAQSLPFAGQVFDTVVCTLGLCTIPDDLRALAEASRALKAGGSLLLLEHVRSPIAPVRWVQRALEPLAVRFEGDHLTREPLEHLAGLSLEVEECDRLKWGIVERVAARKIET